MNLLSFIAIVLAASAVTILLISKEKKDVLKILLAVGSVLTLVHVLDLIDFKDLSLIFTGLSAVASLLVFIKGKTEKLGQILIVLALYSSIILVLIDLGFFKTKLLGL